MKGWKIINKKEYDQIKQLLAIGISHNQIGRITHRSWAAVDRIKKSDNYQNLHVAHKKTPPSVKGDVMTQSRPDETVALLERIASALEKMEVHWRSRTELGKVYYTS